MKLTVGTRLRSITCDAELIVLKVPNSDVDLRCGGAKVVPFSDRTTYSPRDPSFAGGTETGKRYEDQASGLECA